MRYTNFILILLIPILTTAQPPNNTIFFGGLGDGHSSKSFYTGINPIYLGGIGDGHSYQNYQQLNVEFRKGGEGDGWSVNKFEQSYFDFRKGGEGDGWAIVFRPEGPLPVNILIFHAEKSNNSSLLKWIVENEINVSRYEIERSLDGRDFLTIGSVEATGLPNRQTYTFYDHQPNNGINYYRLKNVDADGSFQYSNIAVLYFDQSEYVAIYPNPASEYLIISKEAVQPATFILFDSEGRIVLKQVLTSTTTSIDVSKLPGGIYRYTLYDTFTMKIRGSILIY